METLILGHAGGIEAEVADADETFVGELEACVAHRLSSSYARARLGEALYEIVLDGLHPCPRSLPDPADRAWLREALARPIEAATDEALQVLVARTLDAFEGAPQTVVNCLVERAR
jgi:hypothetical protein